MRLRLPSLFLLAVAALATFAAATPPVVPQIVRPAGANATTVYQYEGFVADFFCVDKRWALDAADMWRQPQQHTLHCLIDIQRCIDSGFCLMHKQTTGDDWGCAYTFGQATTLAIVAHFKNDRMERANLKVRFNATWLTATEMAVDVASMQFTEPAANDTGIIVVLVWSVLSTLATVLVGGILNHKGFALSGGALLAARVAVVGLHFLNVILIIVVSAVVMASNQVAAPVPRAFGVAISYLFLLVLLPTTKHFGVGYIVGSSYEQFIKYHVLVGLTLWLVMSAHGIGMFVVFGDVEPNAAFLFRFSDSRKVNGAGFIAWVLVTVLVVTGLLRSKMYTGFRVTHYLFALVLVFGIVHHPLLGIFIAIPIILWVVDLVLRFVATSRATPEIVSMRYDVVARATVLRMRLKTPLAMDAKTGGGDLAGQHVFLRMGAISPVAQHPFTLAWYDREAQEAAFMIRNTGPGTWTDALAAEVAAQRPLGYISWTGPYGRLVVPLREVGHAVVVAGGIGVTFLTSILSALRNEARAAANAAPDDFAAQAAFTRAFPLLRQVTLVWSVREEELAALAAPMIFDAMAAVDAAQAAGHVPHDFSVSLQIFVTKGDVPALPSAHPAVSISKGRPDVAAVLEASGIGARGPSPSCSAPSSQRTCIYACGPGPVIEAAAAAAAAHGVLFDEQAFSIGPS